MTDDRDPTFARPLGPLAALGWSATFLVVFVLLVSLLAAAKAGAERDGVSLAMLYVASGLLVLVLVLRAHAPEGELRDVLGLRPIDLWPSLLACGMGAFAALPLLALEDAIGARAISPERAAELARDLATSARSSRIAGLLAMVLAAPLVDELFFRGALVSGLVRAKGGGRASATLASTFAFALVSAAGDLHYLPLHLAIGFVLVHARLTTGSLLAALGAQGAYRLVQLTLSLRAFRTVDPLVATTTGAPNDPRIFGAAAGVALVCGLLLMRAGAGEQR